MVYPVLAIFHYLRQILILNSRLWTVDPQLPKTHEVNTKLNTQREVYVVYVVYQTLTSRDPVQIQPVHVRAASGF